MTQQPLLDRTGWSAVVFSGVFAKWLENQEFEQKSTAYLTLTGKLWGVFCWSFGENWPLYNSTKLQKFGTD